MATGIDRILPRVTKPARYVGGEWNSIVKDWDTTDVRIVLCYPDLYEIGQANMGIAYLYDIVNRDPRFACERVFTPWADMAAELRKEGVPLFSLETKRPLGDFDMVGFSLGHEMCYTNVLETLDVARIPVLAAERDDSFPLIIAGGTCVGNPEPLADFIDLFAIGDGEEVLMELVGLYRNSKLQAGGARPPKSEFLRQAARIDGVYVPGLYTVSYKSDGAIASISPTVADAPARVKKRFVAELPPSVTRPIVPFVETVHERGAVEVQRGCTRGCRFCKAGYGYRPLRERDAKDVIQAIDELVKNCGYDEIALVSLSTSDYSQLEEVVRAVRSSYTPEELALSLPSLRVDSFSVKLADSLKDNKKKGYTFAPEAGTDRLRRVINKGLTNEDILSTAEIVFNSGWSNIKFYFMVGLPTETPEDIQGIVELVFKTLKAGQAVLGRKPRMRVGVSTFIPKPHTPFQWMAVASPADLDSRQEILRRGLRQARADLSWTDPSVSIVEAALSLGDRRLGKVIHRAWQLGCTFDAWTERFVYQKWLQAFRECGVSPDFYIYREKPLDEVLPWSHIDGGIDYAFLRREYQRSLVGKETVDCRNQPCTVCGYQGVHQKCNAKFVELVANAKSKNSTALNAAP